ncbi:MAG: hypothetical protein MHM6MM_006026 [Cercozoa sp. M6MM]
MASLETGESHEIQVCPVSQLVRDVSNGLSVVAAVISGRDLTATSLTERIRTDFSDFDHIRARIDQLPVINDAIQCLRELVAAVSRADLLSAQQARFRAQVEGAEFDEYRPQFPKFDALEAAAKILKNEQMQQQAQQLKQELERNDELPDSTLELIVQWSRTLVAFRRKHLTRALKLLDFVVPKLAQEDDSEPELIEPEVSTSAQDFSTESKSTLAGSKSTQAEAKATQLEARTEADRIEGSETPQERPQHSQQQKPDRPETATTSVEERAKPAPGSEILDYQPGLRAALADKSGEEFPGSTWCVPEKVVRDPVRDAEFFAQITPDSALSPRKRSRQNVRMLASYLRDDEK